MATVTPATLRMEEHLQQETERLTRSWMQHEDSMLRDYLVADVQDPRLNVQSILTRHFLIQHLAGAQFAGLREEELRFATVLNWVLNFLQTEPDSETQIAVLDALEKGADNAEGLPLPGYLVQAYQMLPAQIEGLEVPNYVKDSFADANVKSEQLVLSEKTKSIFERLWRQTLGTLNVPPLAVLEPACGSANDYRFFASFGIARCLDYTGLDLCEKNVRNAQALFPGVRFAVGNVFDLPAPDKTVDVCIVHDLFEHLSLEGLERAVSEVCRATRKAICAGFFQMSELADHIVRPVDDYHLNTLSMARTRELFLQHAADVQVIHIGMFLKWCFQCPDTHNEQAYTLVVTL